MHLQKQSTFRSYGLSDCRRKICWRSTRHPTAKKEVLHIHPIITKTLITQIVIFRIQFLRSGDGHSALGIGNESVVRDG